MQTVIPPGARVAFEDEKGRTFFETFDDNEGSRALPFSATLVPWSDDARATYERLVSEKRGAAPEVDDDDDDDDDASAERDTDACASLSLAAYLGDLGVGGAHAKKKSRASTVPEPEGRSARDETRDAEDSDAEPPSDVPFFSASSRVARTLAALAPEIELETSFKGTARGFFVGPEPHCGVRSKRRSSTGSVARLATLNVARVIGVAEVRDETNAAESKKKKLAVLVASPPFERRHTLRSILAGTPEALAGDAQKNLVCFQMCAGLAQLHAAGVSFGGRLDASDVVVRGAPNSPRVELDPASLFFDARVSDGGDSVFPKEKEKEKEKELASATEAWRLGAMSTLEYLTVINARAGRFRGRRDRHAVVPWVADFSENPDVMLRESARFIPGRGDDGYAVGNEKEKGWRDLTKTKWRLTKGDKQLDFSFQHADPKFAHHVSDECLCETTTCVYLARQTPVVELKKRVRSRFVANEYPATVERLYAWSPDEAIPQFYDDPSVFQAPKGGGAREDESSRLGDLRAPSDLGWGDDAFAFVKKHRAILESDRVSHFLPKWIDLTFGVCLFGPKAIAEKNVMVPPADARKPNANARVAVFFHPHPPRGVSVPRNVFSASSSSERSSSFINEDEVLDDKDPTLTALRGDDPISLTGTPYAAPDALAREIAPGPHFAASSKKSVECRSNVKRVASFESDCNADASELGRLIAAVYSDAPLFVGARGKQEDKARDASCARLVTDNTHPVDVNALPSAARAIVRGLLRSGAAAPDADDDDDDDDATGEEHGDFALTAASALDSTFFSPSVRAAAAALSILHGGGDSSPRGVASPLAKVRAARAALASCASDVDATALVAPAAAEAAREAIGKLSTLSTPFSKRFAKTFSRLIGSVAMRVARRAPKAVANEALPPLFRDALAGTRREDAEDEYSESESESDGSASQSQSESESESESESSESPDSRPGSPKTHTTEKKVATASRARARDVLRREMLRPTVMRAARVALGDDVYASSIRDTQLFACLRPGVSVRTARAAAFALEAEADLSETALPVAVREIFSKGLLRRLSYGEHSAFAIKRVSQAFGANNFNAFVAPALTRALGEDTHLDTVASAARRAEISQDDDDIVTPAAAVAAAEGSACKGGWSLTPMRRRKKFTHSEDVRETSASTRRDFSRESGAVAALAATLPLFDRATLLALLFPVFPAPPGPLLRILLAPAPCPALCVAAAELVAAAAKRLAPDDVFKCALPRLKPLFAVASSNQSAVSSSVSDESNEEEEEHLALTLAFAIYPVLGEKISFRALRDSVPDAFALEALFAARFDGWTAEHSRPGSIPTGAGVFSDSHRTLTATSSDRDEGSDPYGWLPAPDARELEADENRMRRKTKRIGATNTARDDDCDEAFFFADDDDDAPWALRLETLCSWRAHHSTGNDNASSFPVAGERSGTRAERLLTPSDAERRGRAPDDFHVVKKKRVFRRGVSALASSADERWLATCGAGDASPASSVVKVWRAGGPRRLRDRRDGDDVIDALAPCFATHDAHGGAHVTCLAFLDGTGGGVPLAASADDAGAVHVWRADTGALLSRVREPNAAGPIGAAPRFAGSREAASRGWEARARAIERRKRIAAAILEQTRDDDDDDDEDDEDDEDDDASRVFSDDGDDDAFASSRDALSPSFPSRHGNRDPGRTAPRRETSASSDTLLDELSGPELGDLIGDDVLGDGPRRRRRAADASAFFASVSRPSPTPSPRAAGLFGYGASDSNDSERFFSEPSSSTGYACLASTNDPNHLVLGTNDGRVRFVDVANERVAGSWLCDASRGGGGGGVFSSVENERKDNHDGASSHAITSVCFFGAGVTDGARSSANALACAGTRNGAVSFLDRRGGRLVAGFRAHDDAVVAIKARGVPPDGSHSSSSATALLSPYLVTASRDKTVCVWDARMLTGASFLGNRAIDTQKKKNPLVSKFVGFGDGVCAMATFGADAFVVAGEKLSVFSLDDRPPNDAGVSTHTVPNNTVPVAPLRLRARNGAKVQTRLTGVAILPRSRLFAVTGEDGKVRVCR